MNRRTSRRPLLCLSVVLCALLLMVSSHAQADPGFLKIDSRLRLDDDGIWSRRYQTSIENGVVALELAGALWFGDGTEVGHTFWQTIDASVISGAAAQVLKYGFSRARPYQSSNANAWFRGSCCQSFPSGEVTLQASFVTPFIADYAAREPWIWSLAALPVYDAMARLKSQAHWQTDVLAGGLLGAGVGYWTTTRATPLSVQILPHGITVGLEKRF